MSSLASVSDISDDSLWTYDLGEDLASATAGMSDVLQQVTVHKHWAWQLRVHRVQAELQCRAIVSPAPFLNLLSAKPIPPMPLHLPSHRSHPRPRIRPGQVQRSPRPSKGILVPSAVFEPLVLVFQHVLDNV